MRNVNIKDVAEYAKVSVTTVTRVINHSESVSPATRERVLRSIEELGFIPNKMASALKNNSTRLIGSLLPTTGINPFFKNVQDAIETYAEQHDYHVLALNTDGDAQKESKMINDLMSRRPEGLIFIGDVLSEPETIRALLEKKIAVIMVERPLDMLGVDKVIINDLEGSSLAAAHLLERGHTHAAFLGVRKKNRPEQPELERCEGFCRAMAAQGCSMADRDTVFMEDYSFRHGYDAVRILFQRYPTADERPTALFVASDILTCGVLQYLYQMNLRVPDDISIISYENTLSIMTAPPISSISFPFDDIGKSVISMFIERKKEGRKSGKSVLLSPVLIDRGTVRQLHNKQT